MISEISIELENGRSALTASSVVNPGLLEVGAAAGIPKATSLEKHDGAHS
jgi:hypothetical protein